MRPVQTDSILSPSAIGYPILVQHGWLVAQQQRRRRVRGGQRIGAHVLTRVRRDLLGHVPVLHRESSELLPFHRGWARTRPGVIETPMRK